MDVSVVDHSRSIRGCKRLGRIEFMQPRPISQCMKPADSRCNGWSSNEFGGVGRRDRWLLTHRLPALQLVCRSVLERRLTNLLDCNTF